MITTSTAHAWTSPDGQIFSYSRWQTTIVAEPAAVLVAIHGLSGAAIDFEPLGQHLAQDGFVTYAPELRGQGNDPDVARRGDLDRIETWFSDLHALLVLVRQQHPGLPVYYYGESMGGAILTRFLADAPALDQPAGLILASPVVALQQTPPLWMNLLFRTLMLVWPTYRVNVGKLAARDKAPRLVTRDEAHRAWFQNAPHKLNCFTIRFFKCLHDLIAGCFEAAVRIRVPVLVVYAHHDVFIRPALVEEFFARLGSMDKELELFPESYHLLLHDHDKQKVLDCLTTWLKRQQKK